MHNKNDNFKVTITSNQNPIFFLICDLNLIFFCGVNTTKSHELSNYILATSTDVDLKLIWDRFF